MTLRTQVNFRFCREGADRRVLWISVISSFPPFTRSRNPFMFRFLEPTMSHWLRKSRSPSGFGGTCILWIFVISLFSTILGSRSLFYLLFHFLFFNTIFLLSSHVYPDNPEMDPSIHRFYEHVICYISDTVRNRTRNLFRPKYKPIPLGHSYGIVSVSQSYHVHVTSKIQVNFRFQSYSKVLMIA